MRIGCFIFLFFACCCSSSTVTGNLGRTSIPVSEPTAIDSIDHGHFHDIQIISSTVQCGFTHERVMITKDRGVSWHEVDDLDVCNILENYSKTRLQNGTVRVWSPDFSFSDDNGKTWNVVEKLQSYYFQGFQFLDEHRGWYFGSKKTSMGRDSEFVLYSTTDGGETWRRLLLDQFELRNETLYRGWFTTPFNGFLIGSSIFKTVDGGRSWENISPRIPHGSIYGLTDGIIFFNTKTGLITSNQGNKYLLTTDGGKTWSSRVAPNESAFRHIEYIDSERGVAVGEGAFVTINGGVEWKKIVDGDFSSFRISNSLETAVFWGKDYLALTFSELFANQ